MGDETSVDAVAKKTAEKTQKRRQLRKTYTTHSEKENGGESLVKTFRKRTSQEKHLHFQVSERTSY